MEKDLGGLMKRLESFAEQKIPPDVFFAVRLDGRGFSKLTERLNYAHPFDEKFKNAMVAVASGLVGEFNAIMAYVQSDEISLVFSKDCDIFDRRAEKLVSTTASFTSSVFAQVEYILEETVMFDSRAIVLPTSEHVIDYLQWRHIDAVRNALTSWAYWTLRKSGKTAQQAGKELMNKNADYKNELLFGHGINFNDVPLWQRRGVLLHWENYEKDAANPLTKQKVKARRRRVKINAELPTGDGFKNYVADLLTTPQS